jgi:VWFA-related protein
MRWVFFAMGLVAMAQEPIRVSTRLIETHVVVRDRHGAVGDLTAESFKLFEDGKPQKIAVFHVSNASAEPQAPKAELPPGVVSNRAAGVLRQTGYRVLLMDMLNTEISDQNYARKQALKMFGEMDVHQPVAIYALSDSLRVLQDFTTDASLLRRAMEAFKPAHSEELTIADSSTSRSPAMTGTANAIANRGNQTVRSFGNRERSEETMEAFAELAESLARVPGRKTVVWITNSFPAEFLKSPGGPSESISAVRVLTAAEGGSDAIKVAQALSAAEVAIYPVHARGLTARTVNPKAFGPGTPTVANLPAELSMAVWIADQTGGKASYNRSDLDASIREALEEADVVYTLGYYSLRDKPDQKFHELKVHVERPDVEVRSRMGYFDREAPAHGDVTALLRRAASAPIDATDIGLTAAMERDGSNFRIAVKVDFADLMLDPEDGKWKGSANLAFVSQSADGKTLEMATKTMRFDMMDQAYQARRQKGVTVEQVIRARKETARIRVVVIDRTGATGAVTLNAHQN